MKTNRIIFDANPLTAHQQTGVGRYTYRLIESMADENTDAVFVGFYYDFLWRKKNLRLPTRDNIKYKKITLLPGAVINLLRRLHIEIPVELLARTRANIALFPNYLTLPSLFGAKIIPVIHDLSYIYFPESMSDKNQRDLETFVPKSLKRASYVFCVSETTKKDLLKEYSYKGSSIITPIPYEGEPTDIVPKSELEDKYGINKPYILFVGTLEPRKNIPALIEAFMEDKSLAKNYSLIICGGIDWKFETTLKKIEEARKLGVEVITTGYVSDEIRNSLFTYCSAFVSAAVYEGFGMPPLEAFHFKRPVALSDIPIFKEVAGDCAVYFNPKKPTDIADAILTAVKQKNIKQPMYAKLTWPDVAKNIWKNISLDTKEQINQSLLKKIVGFGGVGVLNTIIDYAIFNTLIISVGVKPFIANMISTLCALTFSYFMNKRFVFKHHGKFDVKSAVLFLSVTLFGLWIIQGLGMVLLIDITKTINPSLYANHPYLVTNVAKLAASLASIVWNFVLYNSVVFKNEPKK